MAQQVSQIKQGIWYSVDCKLCGGPIELRDIHSYRAIRTLPHQDQENLEHVVPVLEDHNARYIYAGSFKASCIRALGTLQGLYLVHHRCIRIIRKTTSCDRQKVSLLTIISVLAPTAPVDTSDFYPLSELDGDILVTMFSPTSPENSSAPDSPLPLPLFWILLYDLPRELFTQIISYCKPERALAVSTVLGGSYWRQIVKNDVARQRLIVGIQATRLLQDQAHNEVYTEKVVRITGKMTATFVQLGSETYLRDIKEKDERKDTSVNEIDFSLDAPPQLLALTANHLGVSNIAFRIGKDGRPEFLRDGGLVSNMFVHRVDDRSFAFLRIISDPIKIRMVDVALPDHNSPYPQPLLQFSPHPRPLLPYSLGRWVPYSVLTIPKPSLLIEGYCTPSYVDISLCTSIYLSCDDDRRLCGIFDQNREDREEIYLGEIPKHRTVRMFGIHLRTFPLGNLPFLQIQTEDGNFLPKLPDVDRYDVIDYQEHERVKGIWWGKTVCQFYFNVVY